MQIIDIKREGAENRLGIVQDIPTKNPFVGSTSSIDDPPVDGLAPDSFVNDDSNSSVSSIDLPEESVREMNSSVSSDNAVKTFEEALMGLEEGVSSESKELRKADPDSERLHTFHITVKLSENEMVGDHMTSLMNDLKIKIQEAAGLPKNLDGVKLSTISEGGKRLWTISIPDGLPNWLVTRLVADAKKALESVSPSSCLLVLRDGVSLDRLSDSQLAELGLMNIRSALNHQTPPDEETEGEIS
jgi:hypothetical protein